MIERLLAGLVVAMAVSLAGWKANALSGSGAAAAILVGTAIAVGTSWPGLVVLGVFFVLSSLLSRIRVRDEVAEKGSRRDATQVLANGGVAALGALVGIAGNERLALGIVAAALAAATADTWATEIGSTSKARPRMLVSRRSVERGESGGVTSRGLLATLAGATLVGLIAAIAGGVPFSAADGLAIGVAALLGGVAGSLVDSLSGELIQERRFCPACKLPTEARVHHCGTATVHRGGVAGVNNDVVNLLCTLTGAAVGGVGALF